MIDTWLLLPAVSYYFRRDWVSREEWARMGQRWHMTHTCHDPVDLLEGMRVRLLGYMSSGMWDVSIDWTRGGTHPRYLLTQMIIIRVLVMNSMDAFSIWHLAWKGVCCQWIFADWLQLLQTWHCVRTCIWRPTVAFQSLPSSWVLFRCSKDDLETPKWIAMFTSSY